MYQLLQYIYVGHWHLLTGMRPQVGSVGHGMFP